MELLPAPVLPTMPTLAYWGMLRVRSFNAGLRSPLYRIVTLMNSIFPS